MRDWKGLNNTLRRNRSYLNWVGIALGTSTGATVVDNLAYDNTERHHRQAPVVSDGARPTGTPRPRWSTVTHNTVSRSTEASIWIAQSDEPLDFLDVRENLFSGAGTAFLRDAPSLRGLNVKVDANAYSNTGGTPRWLYKAGYTHCRGSTSGISCARRRAGSRTLPPPMPGRAT